MRKALQVVTSMTVVAGCALGTGAALAQAPAYPSKPIRLIVAFPAGGSTDIIARIVGQKLGERLGQQIVIDNRGGAGGTLGTEIAARANPDGYTLTMGTTSTHVIAAGAYTSLKYDPLKDFEPITMVATTPYLLVLNPGVKATTLAEFIALAKAQPGKLNYASAGTGTTTQLAMEMLKTAAGIDVVHIPFNGNGPANTATLGGQVQVLFGSMPAVLAQAKAGRLRAIAVTSKQRSSAAPQLPTMAESGLPGYEATAWFALLAPVHTPESVINRINAETVAALSLPEVRERLAGLGADALPSTPAELGAYIKTELNKWGKVIREAGIKGE